ncbi:MAG TPA: LysR substrate-binding domain-containing protein [Usitatibacter sp.]|nr:LysR substrate-binding domain-containing protein [Usitatibacter sp.]
MLQTNIRRYIRHGTLPQLRLFEASARLGSFTRAAEELHMAQPTASLQIKKLTETVGLPLFEQVGKRIYLTDAGELLYRGCQDVFRAFVALEDALAARRSMSSGSLRVAASSSCKYFAARLLGAFVERHPAVQVSLQTYNHDALSARLAANEDDLYLFAEEVPAEHVVTQALLSNPLVVFARDDHALAGAKAVSFARLAEEPFLVREDGAGTRRITMELFERHGLAPRVRMELSTDESIREAILDGQGVSVMPRYTLGREADPPHLACLDVEGFPIDNRWQLVYRQGKQLSSVARAFLDFSRGEARTFTRVRS